jgi:hypothetical protein
VLVAIALALLLAAKMLRPRRVPAAAVVAVPAALVVSSLWVVLMHQYSAQHWHFIPRHYFLAVFVPLLALLRLGAPRHARPELP